MTASIPIYICMYVYLHECMHYSNKHIHTTYIQTYQKGGGGKEEGGEGEGRGEEEEKEET